MSGVLASILEAKAREIEALRQSPTRARVPGGGRKNAAASLRRAPGQPLRLIAENKRRSPSAGALSTELSTAERVVRYAEAGAAMVSVLCDGPFFDGSWDHVAVARRALQEAGHAIPVLAKEFVLDERQLAEAAACGADAALLIARLVDRPRLRELVACAEDLGLEALVEVVTEDELDAALCAGATIVGVNARDLDTLEMNPERAARVLAAIPERCVAVHLSGVKGAEDVRRLAATRAHAALVGEALMRAADPRPLLASMTKAAAAQT